MADFPGDALVAALALSMEYPRSILRGMGRFLTEHSEVEGSLLGADSLPVELVSKLGKRVMVIGQILKPEWVKSLQERGLVVVGVSAVQERSVVPRVLPDNVAVGRLGAEHLLEMGYSRFAYCGLSEHWYSVERRQGFRARLEEEGHTCIETPEEWTQLDGWLDTVQMPVAVMCMNDLRAERMVRSARRKGLRVPDDVAVLGVDNDEVQGELMRPRISSVDVNGALIGYEASKLAYAMLNGASAPAEVIRIPPIGVVARQSTDMLLIADEEVREAVRFIRKNNDRKIGVEDVVAHLAVSRRWLERRFEEVLKTSPGEVIRRAHVDRAKGLLASTELSVAEVALRSGFSSVKRLGETFSEMVGMTPTTYRKGIRG